MLKYFPFMILFQNKYWVIILSSGHHAATKHKRLLQNLLERYTLVLQSQQRNSGSEMQPGTDLTPPSQAANVVSGQMDSPNDTQDIM